MTVLSRGAQSRRSGRRPGWLLLTVLLVLAIAASSALVFTNRVELLKLAVILALWAAVVAAFVSVIYRRQSDADQAKVRDLKLVYDLQLDREISARREYELTVETHLRREISSELRLQSADEVAALRAELAALRTNLEILFDTDLAHRPAIETDRTRGEWLRAPEPVKADRVIASRVPPADEDDTTRTAESPIIDVPEEPLLPPQPPVSEPRPRRRRRVEEPDYRGSHRRASEETSWVMPPVPAQPSAPTPPPPTQTSAPIPAPPAPPPPQPTPPPRQAPPPPPRVQRSEPVPSPEPRFEAPRGQEPRFEPESRPEAPRFEEPRFEQPRPEAPRLEEPRFEPAPRHAPPPPPVDPDWQPLNTWIPGSPAPATANGHGVEPVQTPVPPVVPPAPAPEVPEEPRGRHYRPADAQPPSFTESERRGRHSVPGSGPAVPPAPPEPTPAARHRNAEDDTEDTPPPAGQSAAELLARFQATPSGGGRRRRRED
ncbi:DUF6779 domain-containing protein [Mycolicibacterium confluentis]|uniref:DUF6779 domain-containing protein n=1 Tax=Mycolicibacterium confluentis TaxID=28047 RepID=A0A7I7XQE0_9MYCO|nr:DUF6779 domain-containing protein [Mycolicibacterium confluentis]MCV7322399.1 hypothetical protein [Mycolicibacterium confluentis]BBZ31448.1 hypothetical protein MCNF_00530 [Mycolicibacterium confluentis]